MESMATVEDKVRAWDSRMRSFPTFEELRDVEYIRRSGRINMITENVQRELYERGRYAGVLWLERCKEHRFPWQSHYESAVQYFETKHGPQTEWFSHDLLLSWEMCEIDSEMRELQARLARLESKKKMQSHRSLR